MFINNLDNGREINFRQEIYQLDFPKTMQTVSCEIVTKP